MKRGMMMMTSSGVDNNFTLFTPRCMSTIQYLTCGGLISAVGISQTRRFLRVQSLQTFRCGRSPGGVDPQQPSLRQGCGPRRRDVHLHRHRRRR